MSDIANKMKLKLGIVGHGFVGKATDWGFDTNVEKFIVDPIHNTEVKDLESFKPQIVFICVPTPMNNDGTQDSSIIEKVIDELMKACPNTIKVVKSTVLPSVLTKLNELDSNLIYNPEFLREKHANTDFENSEMIKYLAHSTCLPNTQLVKFIELLTDDGIFNFSLII